MAFDEQGFINAARKAGYSNNEIKQAVGSTRKGLRKWAFGDAIGAGGKALATIGNVMNLPSYALGGMIRGTSQNPGAGPSVLGVDPRSVYRGLRGVAQKTPVMREAPKALGVDPNSALGMGIGFAGELATPGLPLAQVGRAAGVSKFLGGVDDLGAVSRLTRWAGGVSDDFGRTLLEKSYKLSAPDIDKIADALGVTDEAKKSQAVIDYLEGLGLVGSNKTSLNKLNRAVEPLQEQYNAMTRSGAQIPRSQYATSLYNQSQDLLKNFDTPTARRQAAQLQEEALFQMGRGGYIPDSVLTDTKTRAFQEASQGKLSNPYQSTLSELIGRSGVSTLDQVAPGSAEIGKKLRPMRTAQEIIGKKQRTGLGTQLFNASKGSASGAGLGAAAGFVTGRNPVATGAAGFGLGLAANNPRVLNRAGKLFSNRKIGGAATTGVRGATNALGTAGRVFLQQPTKNQDSQKSQPKGRQSTGPQNQTLRQKTTKTGQQASSKTKSPYNPIERKKKKKYSGGAMFNQNLAKYAR